MDLVFLRHMQTPDNLKGILQGRRDISILPPALEQQQAIAENIQKIGPLTGFDHILVSSLKRTHETARFYTENFKVEPLLDELDFGPYEGRPKTDLFREQPLWETDPSHLVLGESVADLGRRTTAFVDKYRTASKVLAFGHGAWIRALMAIQASGSLKSMNRRLVPNNTLITISLERRKP